MKKKIFSVLFVILGTATSYAQDVTAPEPEFINSYCILTSDSTIDVLPKENGSIVKHENKTKSLLGKIGKVANVASASGTLGAMIGVNTGNLSGALTGLKVAETASSVANTASSVSALASSAGMDIIFSGKSSSYTYTSKGGDIRFLIKGENNEQDPMGIYRIVRFISSKKDRSIQWMELEPSILNSAEAKKGGYVAFTAHKYGEQSYLLTIPASEVEAGEYGIFYMSIVTSSSIPVGTFSVK